MRLIPRRAVEPAERDRALTDLGLELSNSHEEPGQAHFEVWLPLDLDDRSAIHYVDDLPIGLCYFVIKGARSWEDRIRSSFPIMTDEEVFGRAHAAATDAARMEATYMVALVANRELRVEALAELRTSLHHASENVRHAAILALGYVSWPGLETDLEDLAARDASPRVRDRAQRMLAQIAKHGWEE